MITTVVVDPPDEIQEKAPAIPEESVFPPEPEDTPAELVIEIPLSRIRWSPYQPREEHDEEAIERLAYDMLDRGQIYPIIVRRVFDLTEPMLHVSDLEEDWEGGEGYEIVDGHQRADAWYLLITLDKIPLDAGIRAIVRELSDTEAFLATLAANEVRYKVNPIETLKIARRALDENPDLSQGEVAKLLKISPGQISNMLRVLQLPDFVLNLIAKEEMGWTAARELVSLVSGECDHTHLIRTALESIEADRMRYSISVVRDKIIEACTKYPYFNDWRSLDPLVPAEKNLGYIPAFDTESFKADHPNRVHLLPIPLQRSGRFAATCMGWEWMRRQQEAEDAAKEMPERDSTAQDSGEADEPRGSVDKNEWAKTVLDDPLIRDSGITRAQLVNDEVPPELLEKFGTRLRYRKSRPTGSKRITKDLNDLAIADFFNDPGECHDRCVDGAILMASEAWYSKKANIFCVNSACYDRKMAKGLKRFLPKEMRRSGQRDAKRRKWRDRIRPILDANPALAPPLLRLNFTMGMIMITRPATGRDAEIANYYEPSARRIAASLGVAPDVLERAVDENRDDHSSLLGWDEKEEMVRDPHDAVSAASEVMGWVLAAQEMEEEKDAAHRAAAQEESEEMDA